jgi:hypothetical protein
MNGNHSLNTPEDFDFQLSLLRLVTTAHSEWGNPSGDSPERELETLGQIRQQNLRTSR